MEPLQVAQIAALMPEDIELFFWDDRMESIPYDSPTDLMIMSVETYTAKRAYQISSEYRKRNVRVVMGGFHPTLCPDEASEYADTIIIGEAENIWHEVISDFREGKLKTKYEGAVCDFSKDVIPDRTIYKGKNYLKITLVRSLIGYPRKQREVAKGLGLRKLQSHVIRRESPEILGMVRKISHVLRVEAVEKP